MNLFRPISAVVVSLSVLALLAGCGTGGSLGAPVGGGGGGGGNTGEGKPEAGNLCKSTVSRPAGPTTTTSYAGATFTGKVLAGTLPMSGASVQLYAAGNTGNGLAPTALGAAVTTDAAGAFSFTTAYTCPYNLSVLYVVARGGKVTPTGPTNAGAVLMTTLGPCNSISSNPNFVINEVTTVASAYALAQFLSAGGNVGATSGNFSGLMLAAASEANLVNNTTGQAPGANFPTTGTAPTKTLNSIANALNGCLVSGGPYCNVLYTATTVGATVPSNTLDAAMNLARHPASGVFGLYTVSAASSTFAPALAAEPSDWTMFATYSGGGMNGPSGLGIDSAGNVRVASYFAAATYFNNTGTPTIAITSNNLNSSYGLAIDQKDFVWIPNEQSPSVLNAGLGSVTVLDSNGIAAAGLGNGGLNFPVSVAIDPNGISWVVDYGNSHLTLLTNAGVPISGTSGYTTSQFAFPVAVAVDSNCYGFVANQSSNTITRVAQDGSDFTSFVTGSGASGVAVDASNNVWVANYYGNSVGLLSSNAKILSSGYTGGGINHPQGIAIDGAGNAWVANYRGPSLSELAAANATVPGAILSPAAGYGKDAGLLEAFAIAIDAGGNIWVTNFGSNTLTEFIGMAAPVKTPMLGPVATP